MSMHRIPLTPVEESGLKSHGLDMGTPSQLSDVFRQGVAWGQKAEREACAKLCDEQAESESIEPFQYGAEACAKAIRERGEKK